MPKKLTIDWEVACALDSFRVWKGGGEPESINESVHFHCRDLPEVGQVASSEGYDVFHARADTVRVYVLKPDAEVFVRAGVDGKRIVAEVKKGVRQYFRQVIAGKIPLRGKIVGVING